ncbi:MAG TPA: hypothetical protein VNB24_04295 [Acidimicrobiales bacterium]|nr:hypothetical protein [Acidimicrobiales bacterium]
MRTVDDRTRTVDERESDLDAAPSVQGQERTPPVVAAGRRPGLASTPNRDQSNTAGSSTERETPNQATVFASDRSGAWQIYLSDTSLASARVITTGGGVKSRPAISPDGAWIAYIYEATDTTGGSLRLIRRDGTAERTFQLNMEWDDPDWSPDGRTLAVSFRPHPSEEGESHRWAVATIDVNVRATHAHRKVVGGEGHNFQPVWSPDGEELAYVRIGDTGTAAIWVTDSNGSGDSRRVTPEGLHALQPVWSPDGTRIAFVGTRGDGPAHLHSIGTDGSGLSQVTDGDAWDGRPAWAADGLSLLFDRDVDGHRAWGCRVGASVEGGVVNNCVPGANGPAPGQLWSVDLSTREARALTSGQHNSIDPRTQRLR